MQDLMFNFCTTSRPSLFLLLLGWNQFYRSEAPDHYNNLSQTIKEIPRLSVYFTDSPTFNSASNLRLTPTKTGQPTTAASSGAATSSPSTSMVPTAFLSQLPSYWPYTKYALARRPGSTCTSTLTEAAEPGEPAAVVLVPLHWYPRPIGGGGGGGGGLLAGYTHSTVDMSSADATSRKLPPSSTRPG
jgi:hypothetical protein